MAVALVGGAAIGALFGALYDVVKVSMGRTVMQFKPLLADLKFTLDSLRPRIIQQIGDHNVELGLPNEDIENLQRQMEEGIELVREITEMGKWNCYILCSCCNCRKPSYNDQLVELDRSLTILLEILKLQEARDVKEVLLLARKIHDKQDELEKRMSDLLRVQQEAGDVPEFSGSNTGTTTNQQIEGNVGEQGAPSNGGVGAAALGSVFGVLFDTVVQVKDKTTMLKRPLEDLKSTLDSLKPLIQEISECNKVLNLPKEELEDVRMQMEKGAELVHNCFKVHQRTSSKKYEYTTKLLGLDESLQRLLNILRVQLAKDVRESLVSVSNIETMIKRIEGSGVVHNDQVVSEGRSPLPESAWATVEFDALKVQGTEDLVTETLVPTREIEEGVKGVEGSGVVQLQKDQIEIEDSHGVREPQTSTVGLNVQYVQGTSDAKETLDSAAKTDKEVKPFKQIEGSGVVQSQTDIAVAEPPSSAVGLDVVLEEMKRELLKDGVSALVLTGPRGCGKTRLAKSFCQDEEVRDRFNRIFFVRVPKEPNGSLIVEKRYKQFEPTVSWKLELSEEASALTWLQEFMKEIGEHPALLVLDDVWPESESLLNKLHEFKTPNFKILVTSRYEFPFFGYSFKLESLNEEDMMVDSHHSRSDSFRSLDDNDLICVSPTHSLTFNDEDPIAPFHDSSASYLEDKSSNVSTDVRPMAHFHDSSASSMADKSSYASKGVGKKFQLDNPVKSTQTYMQQKLELKVSASEKAMKKVMKAVTAIHGVQSASWDAKNQKLTVVGQLDPALIATRLRKIASKTEVISVGPAKEEMKEDEKEEKRDRKFLLEGR